MPTKHCPDCEPDSPCGGGHVYVIELGHGIQENFRNKNRVHLYVGETQNTVERRMQSNLTRADKKTVVSEEEARQDNTNDWHFVSVKIVRKHYLKHRPDLYFHLNPIEKNREQLKIAERRLSRQLESAKENGIRKFHVHGDGKKKKKKKKKRSES